MKTKILAIDLLRLDGETQSRIRINEDVVDDYTEVINENGDDWPFEPLDVFHDGSDYFVSDGFHRTLAAQRAKRASIPCIIHKGTAKDARIFGMTANDRHGLRMSHADKRSCVEWLLENGGRMTQKEIAAKAGVSRRKVQMIVADRNENAIKWPEQEKAQNAPSPTRSGYSGSDSEKDGRTDSEGKDGQLELDGMELPTESAPGPPRNGKEKSRASFSESIKLRRSRAVKTVEALMRAVDDLHELMPSAEHQATIQHCKWILETVKEW